MVAASSLRPLRTVLSPLQLASHANQVQFHQEDLSWTKPIDRSMWLICPTLGPLYYTPSWRELSDAQQLRYNHLFAMCANELVGLFERFLQPIFNNLFNAPFLPADLRALLPEFVQDESRHAEIWHRMNQMVEPTWYEHGPLNLVQFPTAVRIILGQLTAHPAVFPVAVWITLILEEHSLEMTRRCLQCELPIEPRFLAAFRFHAQEEARHVQIDWHILDYLLARLSRPMMKFNAWLLRITIERFFFSPVNIAMRVVGRLTDEFADLKPRLPQMKNELACLSESTEYRRMIFSRSANPMSFDLGLRLAETRPFFETLC